MEKIKSRLEKIGIGLPDIFLPSGDVDLTKWSVVACDQYTSQPEYWADVEKLVNDSPSTLRLILPEVYLEDENSSYRILDIRKAMDSYINEGVLSLQKPGLIYVERKTSHSPLRKGLILSVDLEKYDYAKGSTALIRATEGTVIERIPPRVKIREKAALELPHIMLLIDDPERSVVEPLAERKEQLQKLYDFELMMDGGHISGYKIEDEDTISSICGALEKLADPAPYAQRYGIDSGKGMILFAVGDGNHSLASAKAHWENVKCSLPSSEIETHPARYALVEVVNVHDDGLIFEPIHRVVFNISLENILDEMKRFFSDKGCIFRHIEVPDAVLLFEKACSLREGKKGHVLPYVCGSKSGCIIVENPTSNLEVGTLQAFLDKMTTGHPEVKIDYIHGDDVVQSLGSREGNLGFFLPPMNKHDLFKTVLLDGALPRKTFSMGEASEKRFYLECRKIVR